jgi:hypothetical protein
MADVIVKGDTSGAVTLSAPAVAGTVTVTLPSTTGTMAVLPTATGVLAESAGGTGTTTGYYGFKNRLINSAMVIDQRNAGASVTNISGAVYTMDRFAALGSQASKFTVQQNAGSVTPPAGFINYAGVTSSSAYSLLAGDYFTLGQAIEGLNVADLAWGTASAATVTLSFWVRSSLTGTFGGNFRNNGGDRNYPFTYTISSANTWEQKSVTIAGDTSGTWLKTNAIGINVGFGLGVGSTFSGTAGAWSGNNYLGATGATSVVGTNGATFYITGVQLEKGSTATSFDYRPYTTELQLCQRYCPVWTSPTLSYNFPFSGQAYSTTAAVFIGSYPVQPRVAPTGITTSGTFTATTNIYGATSNGTLAIYGAGMTIYSMGLLLTGTNAVLVAGNSTGLVAGSSVPAKIIAEGCEL